MKIIKPLSLGILNRPYRHRGQNRLSLAAIGFFPLGAGTSERLLTENLQWAKIVPQLPAGMPLDHVMPKARAEVMLSGAAHAIGDPVASMAVRLRCGPVDKHLCVVGDRKWTRRFGPWLCVEAAKPFQRVALSYENAFGGAGHAGNPLGRGFLRRFAWLREREGLMPNIELPDVAVLPGRRQHVPASFAPSSLLHAARNQSGTYDQRWLDEDFPGLPRDFDFGLFNLAPADQQFAGAMKGDEPYRLEGVHPKQAAIEGCLPGLRARAFVLREGQDAAQTEEVPLACDTVWFFPEQDIGMLVFRGETVVEDSDALDVQALMVAYERLDAAPRTLAHYREVMALRLDAQTAAQHAFNESQLAPPRSAEAIAVRTLARAQRLAAQRAEQQQLLDEQMAEFWQKSGMTPPPDYVAPTVPAPQIVGPTLEEIADGDFDLAELQAQAQALADAARRDGEARLAAGQAELKAKLAEKFPAQAPQPAPSAEALAQQAIARAAVVAHDLVAPAAAAEAAMPPALRDILDKAEAAQPGSVDAAQRAQIADSLAALPPLKRAARAAAPTPAATIEVLPEPAALALGAQILQWLREGVPLAGRDLAGASLRDADLRGADLREVQLERADLRGAKLAGANLQKAVLTAARLDGADFSGAQLDGANLCGSQAIGTCFRSASLCSARAMDAVWSGSDLQGARLDDLLAPRIELTGACLDDTQLARAALPELRAPGSRWRNSRWLMSVATAAALPGADFSGARLERSVLMDADLQGADWSGAKLASVYAGGKSDWQGATLAGADFRRCGLRGAKLAGADMRGGVFTQSDFGDADLSQARMDGARFYRSLFLRSRLQRVQARQSDFFQALCRKADFSDADLRDAVLVQADLAEATWQGADRSGARVDQKASLK